MSFKILVMSCDKNEDLWKPFHHCIEKYWKNHPQVIYSTETKTNPYYTTVNNELPIEKWTKRIWDIVNNLDCDNILLMVDDIFIRDYVDNDYVNQFEEYIGGIIASINFEKTFDPLDIKLDGNVSMRNHYGRYKTSVMCQLWNRKALLDIFNCEKNPWDFEKDNDSKGYVFLISNKGNLLNWGYNNRKWFGIRKGKWCKECKDFFDKENLDIDYSIRGFYE